MSQPPHGIDNQEPLFQFDPFEGSVDAVVLERASRSSSALTACGVNYSHDVSSSNLSHNIFLNHDLDMSPEMNQDPLDVDRKGKGVSKPMPIRTQGTLDDMYDNFDMSSSGGSGPPAGPSDSTGLPSSPSPFEFQTFQIPLHDIHQTLMSSGHEATLMAPGSSLDNEHQLSDEPVVGKGKAREIPPTLPPLTFTPTEFGYAKADWPSPGLITPTPGPSSYGSGYGSLVDPQPSAAQEPAATHVPNVLERPSSPIIRRMPSRRRSLSNLSVHSTHSLAVRSMSRIKVRIGSSKGPSNLARKLLFRKRGDSLSLSNLRVPGGFPGDPDLVEVGQGNCLMPWRNKDSPIHTPLSAPELDIGISADQTFPVYHSNYAEFKGKGRSYSSPLPMSAMDYIPSTSTDIFVPIPIVLRNSLEEVLPRELKLQILLSLVHLHEVEYDRLVDEGRWTALKASSSKNKWVGRDKGVRELIKLSRVSKSWQSLVFDGQLWTDLNLRSFPRMPSSLLSRLVASAGGFIRGVDVTGHTRLQPSTLLEMADNLCVKPTLGTSHLSCTQLTAVNLQGCSTLTPRSLEYLLVRSPALQMLCLKGLAAVTNGTCEQLAVYCTHITSLDISRCPNVDGEGIRTLATAAIGRGKPLPLTELRLTGLARFNDGVLSALGKAAPYLEVLDLSYIRTLHNSAVEAFVSCDDERTADTVLLTSREAGRDPSDSTRYRRRITRLRHLSLSSCILLTDIACSNLAHTVPRLEFLELAGIGADLKDHGLVRLLNTTPFIRKLDLEDACDITDDVLVAITPTPVSDTRPRPPEPGHALEHLTISYASNLTDDSLSDLIQGCTRLRVLEADNTPMSGAVLKEFVRTARKRKIVDPRVVAIDCRGVGESLVKDLSVSTRPRLGWRSYQAKKLAFLDARDQEDLKVGQDECDEKRVVLKSFYSWQTVDAVRAARDKRRKSTSRRVANESTDSVASGAEDVIYTSGRSRWWSPGGSRSSGTNSPAAVDGNDRDGCRIM